MLKFKSIRIFKRINHHEMRSIKSCVNKYLVNHQYSDKLMNIIYKMIEPNEDQRLDFEDLLEELDKNF